MLVFGEGGLAAETARTQIVSLLTLHLESVHAYLRSQVGSWQIYGRLPV